MASRPPPRKTPDPHDIADRLHSSAIRLLRRLRRLDDSSGLSAPRLSALSVLVFAGPQSLKALARAEQVRPPTMTRLVQALERDGLVRRKPDPTDRRGVLVESTERGRAVLHAGRRRRLAALAAELAVLPSRDLRALERALPVLVRVGSGEGAGGGQRK